MTRLPPYVVQAVFDELCDMLCPPVKPFVPKKGKPNVIMFVGLQVSSSGHFMQWPLTQPMSHR